MQESFAVFNSVNVIVPTDINKTANLSFELEFLKVLNEELAKGQSTQNTKEDTEVKLLPDILVGLPILVHQPINIDKQEHKEKSEHTNSLSTERLLPKTAGESKETNISLNTNGKALSSFIEDLRNFDIKKDGSATNKQVDDVQRAVQSMDTENLMHRDSISQSRLKAQYDYSLGTDKAQDLHTNATEGEEEVDISYSYKLPVESGEKKNMQLNQNSEENKKKDTKPNMNDAPPLVKSTKDHVDAKEYIKAEHVKPANNADFKPALNKMLHIRLEDASVKLSLVGDKLRLSMTLNQQAYNQPTAREVQALVHSIQQLGYNVEALSLNGNILHQWESRQDGRREQRERQINLKGFTKTQEEPRSFSLYL